MSACRAANTDRQRFPCPSRGPREVHWFAGQPLASIDLAIVRLRSGALDGAAALGPALSLPVQQRITVVTTRLAEVRKELAGLHSLPGGPA